jgi:hypothetical protein
MDERAESWRSEGWAGQSGTAAGHSTGLGSADDQMTRESPTYDLSEDTRISGDLASTTDAGSATSVLPVPGGSRAVDLDADASDRLDRDVASTRGTGLTGAEAG